MNFIDEFKKTLDEKYNVSVTENGAVGYATTNHALLDMNFKVASYRKMSDEQIIRDFVEAANQDFELSIAWLFYVRDVREGLGERRLFRVLIKSLAGTHPELVRKLVKHIAEYGRYDDLFELLDTEVKNTVVEVIVNTLNSDIRLMDQKKPISLLAKWMPSNNTSSAKTRARASLLETELKLTPKQYRKLLSKLRGYLQIVESKMSAKEWSEIDYETVPSKANLIYKNAFLKHDEDRRREYLDALTKGEVKINSAVLFPHEIVHKYMRDGSWYRPLSDKVDPTLEGLWKNLPEYGLENTLVVADGSGSMTCSVGNGTTSALEVANALAIYTAERAKGAFKDTFITFSSRPQLVHLGGKTLLDNLKEAYNHNECSDTNIEAVFDLILSTAVKNHMKQEEMPRSILVISDMEFNYATCGTRVSKTLFGTIAKKYEAYGYILPRLVFWNVNSRSCTIPVTVNEAGVALVSGFSVNILKMVMKDELDPWKLLISEITSERYQPILKEVLN